MYFIEKFITAISSDPQLTGLAHPSELFDARGTFNISLDTNGFRQIPTPKNLIRRITVATDHKEKADLQTFLLILLRAINQITGGLGTVDSESVMDLARRYAPQVRQRQEQTFVPMAVEDYLNYRDAALAGHFYHTQGRQPLSGNIFDLMFENPIIPTLTGIPEAPYQARVPFVATVGIDPSVAPYPANLLSVGRLNLSAADARLTSGRTQTTVYVEMKAVYGSLVLNREYDRTASFPGRFLPLRNNRIHKDPLLNLTKMSKFASSQHGMMALTEGEKSKEVKSKSDVEAMRLFTSFKGHTADIEAIKEILAPIIALDGTKNHGHSVLAGVGLGADDATEIKTPVTIPDEGPYLLIYHLFYPVDDEARKRGKINSTNREGHHLAVGLLLQAYKENQKSAFQASQVLISRGPDNVQVIPFDHPVLTHVRDDGTEVPDGMHVVLYTVWRSPLAMGAEAGAGGLTKVIGALGEIGEEYSAALSTLAAIAAGAAVSGLWPVAAAAVLLLIIVLLMCIFSGCGSDDHDVFEGEPVPGSFDFALKSDPEYQNPNSYITPGMTTPRGIHAAIRLIPHFIDQNLYGLHGEGDNKFEIDDSPRLKEMLAWVAFPGGIGYPLEREFPGKQDVPGSSWRNYFDIFVEKLFEVRYAQARVSYFGA